MLLKGVVHQNIMLIQNNGKTGYGFCVEDDQYGYHSGRKDWWNLPHSEKIKWYYFTEKEMSEYFITEEEDYKAYLRDEKIKQVLN